MYELAPEGLNFVRPAYAVHEWPGALPGMISADGSYALAVHYARAADGTVEAVPTATLHRLDGHLFAIGTVMHLSSHWAERHARVRSQTRDVCLRIDAMGGQHEYDERWRWRAGALTTSGPIHLHNVTTGAYTWDEDRIVTPLGEPGVPASESAPPFDVETDSIWVGGTGSAQPRAYWSFIQGPAADLAMGIHSP